MNMSQHPCRWGILGTADIAKKNWLAISNSGNAMVTAVASRDPQRAQQFVDFCQAHSPMRSPPTAYGSYEELLASPEVDAVYLPLPTGVRQPWAIAAARARKHVLLEKPCCVSTDDLTEVLHECAASDVQFMDGVMFMHSARIRRLREVLQDGTSVGEIRHVASAVSFLGGDDFLLSNIRSDPRLEPFGCLGDLGWYCIRVTLLVLNWQLPNSVSAHMHRAIGDDSGKSYVPFELTAELSFDQGVSASFYCSFVAGLQEWVTIAGTRGYLLCDDFMLPRNSRDATFSTKQSTFEKSRLDFQMEHRDRHYTVPEKASSHANAQETNMFRHFSQLILEGRREACWGDYSLRTQQVMDACLQSALQEGQRCHLPHRSRPQ